MVTYNVVLFLHILGVVALFAAFAITQLGGAGLRRAESTDEARLWLGMLRVTGPMFGVAFFLILAAGLYMTVDVWTFSTSWVDVALVTAGIMVVLGTAVVGRGLSRMGQAAATAPEGRLSPDLRDLIADRAVWLSLFTLNGFGFAVLWLMTNKPGWAESILVVLVLGIIGAVLGSGVLRRGTSSAPR